MTVPRINDDSALSINIKWLIQIIILVGGAVLLFTRLEKRVADLEDESRAIRYNQNTYVFPDIRLLEQEVLDFKLNRERFIKDIQRINEKIDENH
jgi:hypothetical protein